MSEGTAKKVFEAAGPGTPLNFRFNPTGGLHVEQGLPSRAEMARQARIFTVTTAGGTAKAPITAWPTTTATFFLYNGNPKSGNRVLLPLDVWAWSVSGTIGLGGALLAAVTLAEQTTVPSAYSGTVVSGTSGQAGSNTGGILANAHTITGAQPAWRVVAGAQWVAAVSQGTPLIRELDGDSIIKPGHGMALAVLSPVGTTSLFGYGATFADIDLETL